MGANGDSFYKELMCGAHHVFSLLNVLGLIMVCLCSFSGSTAPKNKCVGKRAINMRLVDENSGDEHSGGLNELQNVYINPKA